MEQRRSQGPGEAAIALLDEVIDQISRKKESRGPAQTHFLVPLKVRDRILWFLNDPRAVTLALRDENAMEDLQWFVREFQQDARIYLIGRGKRGVRPLPVRPKLAHDVPDGLVEPITEALESIRAFASCRRASFRSSKAAFTVIRNRDGAQKSLTIKGMRRQQAQLKNPGGEGPLMDLQGLKRKIQVLTMEAISFIDQPADDHSTDDPNGSD